MYLVNCIAGSVVKVVQSVEPDLVYSKGNQLVFGQNRYEVTLLVYVNWSKQYYCFLRPIKVADLVPMGNTELDYERFVENIRDLY